MGHAEEHAVPDVDIQLPAIRQETWNRFRDSALPMIPEHLKEYFPGYGNFQPILPEVLQYNGLPLVWGRRDIAPMYTEKRLVALLATTGVGKDAVVTWMMEHSPGLLQQIITHTSRTPRGGAEMYELVSRAVFEELLKEEILEHVRMGKEPDIAYYGTTKASLAKNFSNNALFALWRGEVYGWINGIKKKLPAAFPEKSIGMVAIAMLPTMNFAEYETYVEMLRGKDGASWRIPRAMQEMQAFADPAFDVSFIVLNPRTESGPRPAGEALTVLLRSIAGESRQNQ